MNNHY